jgi:CheY-like chemotaxis protein
VEKPFVLVADDNEGTCTLIRALLRGSFEVDVATDGVEAIARLNAREYAAVLLDLLMPGTDGFAVLEHLASNQPHLLSRVLVLTAAVSPRQMQRVREYSVRGVIAKPFDVEALTEAVQNCASQGGTPFGGGPMITAPMLFLLAAEMLRRV